MSPVDDRPMDADGSIGSDLATVRLRHRMVRLELALTELRRQAQLHRERDAVAPAGLIRAMRDFERELAAARRALHAAPDGPS